jgi:hypothetical protein
MKLFSLLLLLLLSISVKAQDTSRWYVLRLQEERLKTLGTELVDCREAADRRMTNAAFTGYLTEALAEPGSVNFPFDSVRNMRILQSPDKLFRIMTWTLRHERDSFQFFGCIQWYDQEKEIIWLRDSSHRYKKDEPLFETLDADNWYGALYYQLVQAKYRKQKYYILMGWDGNDSLTDKKIIETLSFDEQGKPVFGRAVFQMQENAPEQYRVIFEFGNGAVMTLRHERKKNIITFEHLVPPNPNAKGDYRMYFPDGTYDYFVFKKGVWIKKEMLFDNTKDVTDD